MKKTDVNSEVIYEASKDNLKTTDPQIEYQVNDNEYFFPFLIEERRERLSNVIIIDSPLDHKPNNNNFVVGKSGRGIAYHFDLSEVEQFAKPDEVEKL